MTDWHAFLAAPLNEQVRSDPFWNPRLAQWTGPGVAPFAIHLAVFVEPYLQYVLDGKKTVESRFSVNRCAPYRRVEDGDVILLKRSGGPVVGLCQVSQVWSYRLAPESWEEIRQGFTEALCAQDPQFWKQRERASFASLMLVRHVVRIQPLHVPKQDRRGWVILQDRPADGELTLPGL